MKQTTLILLLVLTTCTLCKAQEIEMEKAFGGWKYSQEGRQLSMNELVNTMKSNQEAYDLIKKAKSNTTLASVFGGLGGALVGWPLGTALGGGDPNWVLAGVGAGLIVIGIPISVGANKKAKEAVGLYNASLNETSFYRHKPEFKINVKGTGLGVSMVF